MNCEKCGKEIDYLSIDTFDWDGSDSFETLPITEDTDGSVYVDVEPNWTGYGLSEEEMPETIRCPECGQFPLENREIHAHDMVRVVLFRKEYEADALLAAWNRRGEAPIRCENCKHASHLHEGESLEICGYLCGLNGQEMRAEDFCSQGERIYKNE